jgi:undecaprenyl-diphosphatase
VSEYLIAAILGVLEGLTEFLPVSSTAHLRVAQALMGVDLGSAYWKMFSIVIQLGAILCLPIYFRARLLAFVATFPHGKRGDRTALTHPLTLTGLAFAITAVPSYLLANVIGKNLESLYIMGGALVVGGVLMWAADALHARNPGRFVRGRLTDDVESMTSGQAIWIGACQILAALFPGTSRSMSTITAGMLAGMSRAAALEFSFFLSIPTMGAATLYDLVRSLPAIPHTAHAWILLTIGFVVSFVVAYAVVAWFMAWVRTRGFVPFAIYRIVAGAALLWWVWR